MSCGFSPKTFEMIQQMQAEQKRKDTYDLRKKAAYEAARLEAKEKRAARLRQRQDGASSVGGEDEEDSWDWSRSYRDWDDWQDEEELEEQRRAAEAEAEKARNRRPVPGCNHDHSAERKLVDMSTAEKLRGCHGFRLEGNAWFREGQHFRAGEKFRKVLVWLEYTFAEGEEEERLVDEVRLAALLNLSVCKLKTQQFDEVKENTYQALKLDPDNVKALYCRAQANRRTDHFALAKRDILRAARLAPYNVEVRKELARLRNQVRRYKQRNAEVSRAMFGQGNKCSSSSSRATKRRRRAATSSQGVLTYAGMGEDEDAEAEFNGDSLDFSDDEFEDDDVDVGIDNDGDDQLGGLDFGGLMDLGGLQGDDDEGGGDDDDDAISTYTDGDDDEQQLRVAEAARAAERRARTAVRDVAEAPSSLVGVLSSAVLQLAVRLLSSLKGKLDATLHNLEAKADLDRKVKAE